MERSLKSNLDEDYRNLKSCFMKSFRLGSNFAVFLLFFGMAMIEAITGGRIIMIGFWFLVAIVFFLADNRGIGSKS